MKRRDKEQEKQTQQTKAYQVKKERKKEERKKNKRKKEEDGDDENEQHRSHRTICSSTYMYIHACSCSTEVMSGSIQRTMDNFRYIMWQIG